jgi:hypothetical protein
METTGEHHCGTSRYQAMRYKLEVTCTGDLDGRDFLFEQLKVREFFEAPRREHRSCEKLARDWCADLLELINRDSPDCTVLAMNLTLSPAPFEASITYRPRMVDGQIEDE